MKFIHVLVEGQTEETFVGGVLAEYLGSKGIYPTAKLAVTKWVKKGGHFKGGISAYSKVKYDIQQLLRDKNAALVTTMLDYYNLPGDFPGYHDRPAGSCFRRVESLERAFSVDIANPRFLPYLALHEFEAMMFADPDAIARQLAGSKILDKLRKIGGAYASPEEIDEDNPPSKRLIQLYPPYEKTFHGPLVTEEIGIERIRQACAHFDQWLQQLEALA